ncbi:MAG: hypothetical protein RL375_1895, partial [Pseudomonadota bacterium]
GHKHGDIMGYTWAQFITYLRIGQARDAADQATELLLMNQAFAGGEGATKLLRELNRKAEG